MSQFQINWFRTQLSRQGKPVKATIGRIMEEAGLTGYRSLQRIQKLNILLPIFFYFSFSKEQNENLPQLLQWKEHSSVSWEIMMWSWLSHWLALGP